MDSRGAYFSFYLCNLILGGLVLSVKLKNASLIFAHNTILYTHTNCTTIKLNSYYYNGFLFVKKIIGPIPGLEPKTSNCPGHRANHHTKQAHRFYSPTQGQCSFTALTCDSKQFQPLVLLHNYVFIRDS